MSPAINKIQKNRNTMSGTNRKKASNNLSKSKLKKRQRQFIIQKQNTSKTDLLKNIEAIKKHQEEVNIKDKKDETQSNNVAKKELELKKDVDSADHPKGNQKRKLEEASHNKPSKKNKKRKKSKVKSDTDETSTYKPIMFAKNSKDYSANWNQLKDIIAKSDKKIEKSQLNDRKGSKENSSIKSKQGKVNKVGKEKSKKTTKPEKTNEKPDIWFDDVDPILLEDNFSHNKEEENTDSDEEESEVDDTDTTKRLVKENSYHGETKYIAMDCEMVGVGSKFSKDDSILARVSLVNHFGQVLYDTFVKPTEKVTDYRTEFSGVRPADLQNAEEFSVVQEKVSALMNNRIVVGHALHNDFKVLFLSHPRNRIRDTSKYRGFRKLFGGRNPSLKKLIEKVMGVQIQKGEHNSIQDAQAAMRLFTLHRKEWEASLKKRPVVNKKKPASSQMDEKTDSS